MDKRKAKLRDIKNRCEELTYFHGVSKGDNCRNTGQWQSSRNNGWHVPRIAKRHQNSDLRNARNFKQVEIHNHVNFGKKLWTSKTLLLSIYICYCFCCYILLLMHSLYRYFTMKNYQCLWASENKGCDSTEVAKRCLWIQFWSIEGNVVYGCCCCCC